MYSSLNVNTGSRICQKIVAPLPPFNNSSPERTRGVSQVVVLSPNTSI